MSEIPSKVPPPSPHHDVDDVEECVTNREILDKFVQ